jgi:pimeloyl-ACP methyl ester carboxylesterase
MGCSPTRTRRSSQPVPRPRPSRSGIAAVPVLQTARVVLLQRAFADLLQRAFADLRLEAPTRLLFGADDFYIPLALLEDLEANGDDLTLEIVRGCSHWLPEERPDLVADRALALFG